MHCPFCKFEDSKVVDSRPVEDGKKIRRRRECEKCGARFTTYEIVETIPLVVVKRDRSRQVFDKRKLLNRLLMACGKRPVPLEMLERAVEDIESQLVNSLSKEVPSQEIAKLCMQKLRDIDVVAYIRFVSVYREFSTIEEFMEELNRLT